MNIGNKDRSRLIAAATQRIPCGLVIENIRLVNVLTGEIYPAAVEILDGVIVYIRTGEGEMSNSVTHYDGKGMYLLPGFIDIHMHVESSMMTPENFERQAVLSGTTSVFVDPHEIGNVLGKTGIDYMLDTPGMFGIAEVMDYAAVIHDTPRMHDILAQGLCRDVMIQGHAPKVAGRALAAYRLGGPMNVHTARSPEELVENLRAGMHVSLQSSSLVISDLQETVRGLADIRWTDLISLCTDDVHAKDLYERGHINALMAQLVQWGIDPVTVVKWGTWNAAREAGIDDLGAIAPGYVADLQLVEHLNGENPKAVFVAGKLVAENGRCLVTCQISPPPSPALFQSVLLPEDLTEADFSLCPPGNTRQVAVVECAGRGRAQFMLGWHTLPMEEGRVTLGAEDDYCFVTVANRHGGKAKTVAVYHGLGLKQGAMATTIAHDALAAALHLKKIGGGFSVVRGGRVVADLPLPIAGLMSELPCPELVGKIDEIYPHIQSLYSEAEPSLLKLSLLSLTVLPGIAITDKGLVDGTNRACIQPFRTVGGRA